MLLFAFVYPSTRQSGDPIPGLWYAGGIAAAAALFFFGQFTYRSYLGEGRPGLSSAVDGVIGYASGS